MSSSENNIHESLARRLEENWFKKTSLAQAVWELVQSYIVGHTNPWDNITKALNSTSAHVDGVLPSKTLQVISLATINWAIPAANESKFDTKKTGTHG